MAQLHFYCTYKINNDETKQMKDTTTATKEFSNTNTHQKQKNRNKKTKMM